MMGNFSIKWGSFLKRGGMTFFGFVICSLVTSVGFALQPGFDQVLVKEVGVTRAWGVGAGDFNNDGIEDIVTGDTYGDVHLYLGNGDGTFVDGGVVINQTYHNAYALAAADFNDDGNDDFVLTMTGDYGTTILDGQVHLYLGNGDGTFVSNGWPQAGQVVGDAGTDVMAVAAADVDGDGDVDLVAGDVTGSGNSAADVTLYRNQGNDTSGNPTWAAETIVSATGVVDPELPPYYPPTSYMHGYGVAFGDLDGDGDQDLLLSDRASYAYVYRNDGAGNFAPIRYNAISTRPLALGRLHAVFTSKLSLSCGDFNGDGLVDFVTGGSDGDWEGVVDLWLNEGNDGSGNPQFGFAGNIGANGTDAKGIATLQINSDTDSYVDVVFGNYEGVLTGLLTDRTDTDGDGIIDRYDNAPLYPNAPRLDMNDDGGINSLDQLDNDQDGVGDPADADDDDDGVDDITDNSPMVANADQKDTDGDGRGDASDPLNDTDSDGDGILDGPIDPELYMHAMQAKGEWSKSDTHFIIRIDALGRAFQNEFTQLMTDAAIWGPTEWETKKLENYNGIGDSPATSGYQVPSDLPGGKSTPLTLVVIPRRIWNAFGDPDPVAWMNDRLANDNLEIGQHGTYHANNTMLGDWASDPTINYYSCETCGFTMEEMFQYLRVGKRTLLGDYSDMWLQDSGADPATSPYVDWTNAANPLISYAPPFNTSDAPSRDAISRLGYLAFSASIWEENTSIFTPEGSHHEQFDQFGMYHASADLQVDPEYSGSDTMTYTEYLNSITQFGQLNTWLIEEVEWCTRYCNDLPRLEPCAASPSGLNRETNMVDPDRWAKWLTLLDFVNANGQPMTLGDYALAVSFDNAPTVANPDQADADHDGIGDVIDDAVIASDGVTLAWNGDVAEGTLTATLTAGGNGIADQTVQISWDSDGDGTDELLTATTDSTGTATVTLQSARSGGSYLCDIYWDGILVQSSTTVEVTVPCTLAADLTGDCQVRFDDFAVLASEWMMTGDTADCALTADIAGSDCTVDMADLEVLAGEWLN
ncbi:hypothetical protein STSP2_00868 [Anaerohalosphaera lusitana]|uniref:Ig-like domain-containing protein n=1 Tax=Anaerohalosphaera lusitana TaxID=1936003 RepID=A0A1U9NJG9_9BACT|nr:FG-GAP-like repeat-containing protein [Anaerohalosphaera lusitana]AQT67720.1 hypothetical protein STSP2_00868 [Anaerohalosphaera lusitana]